MLLLSWLLVGSAACAFAQNPFSLKLSGTAGFGIDSRGQATNFGYPADGQPLKIDLGQREMATDLSLNASGFVYHPKLLLYNVLFNFQRNSTAIDERGMASNGIGVAGSISFLPDRSFGTTFYFERNGRQGDGSLGLAFTSHRDMVGLRGRFNLPRLAHVTYNVGKSNSLETWDGFQFDVRQQFANLDAQRSWSGWDFHAMADYTHTTADSTAQTRNTVSTLQTDVARTFRERMRLNLNVRRVAYSYLQGSGGTSSDNAVTAAYGMLTWQHSPRLESHYAFMADRNSVNTLALLVNATGAPNPGMPLELQTLHSFLYSSEAGVTYRPTPRLSVGGRVRYQGQNFDRAGAAPSSPLVNAGVTTGELRATGESAYQRRIWKLDYQASGWLEWQQFRYLLDGTSGGIGWATSQGVTVGNENTLRLQGTYSFSSRSKPVFFRMVNDREQRLSVAMETMRLRIHFRAEAEISRGNQQWPGSKQRLNRTRYGLSATRGNLNVSAIHSSEDSNQLLFGPGSPLWQPGGSTGAAPIPPGLFHPLIFGKTKSDVVAAVWEPKRRLRLEDRYLRFRYTLIDGQNQEETNWQWDNNAQYEFGRFTLVGGYVRGQVGRIAYLQHENRYYFRVRFPFNIF